MIDKLEFDLESSIKVQANIKGENTFIDLNKLQLKAPNYKHKDYTIALKKKFMEALFGMTNSVNKDEAQSAVSSSDDDKLDVQSIKAILYASPNFDIVSFYNKFVKFLTVDICFKDEEFEQCVTKGELEKLSEIDLENLIAKYIEVFFIVSWMKTLK